MRGRKIVILEILFLSAGRDNEKVLKAIIKTLT